MRVRGLKLQCQYQPEQNQESHPMRVRGLKHDRRMANLALEQVAPYAGAWIETRSQQSFNDYQKSHPMRVRGLKLVICLMRKPVKRVAPYAGAWIETFAIEVFSPVPRSHPMRVRGLKRRELLLLTRLSTSHPMRVRGLKHAAAAWKIRGFSRTLCGCVD